MYARCLTPVAARETSGTTGNLLSVLNLGNPQVAVSTLPVAKRVIPSSLCHSSTSPTDEPTNFLKMINSGMCKGFQGN